MKDDHNCCCGHDHGHDHDHHGEHHHHHHGHHHHEHGCCGKSQTQLSQAEEHFLSHLVQAKFLPIAQFVVKSSKEDSFETVALSPVFIEQDDTTIERVKELGRILKRIEDAGYIDLDFDIPLTNYAYTEFKNSQLFAFFQKTVEEGSSKENFLGDIALLECGSIAPTEKCLALFSKE